MIGNVYEGILGANMAESPWCKNKCYAWRMEVGYWRTGENAKRGGAYGLELDCSVLHAWLSWIKI